MMQVLVLLLAVQLMPPGAALVRFLPQQQAVIHQQVLGQQHLQQLLQQLQALQHQQVQSLKQQLLMGHLHAAVETNVNSMCRQPGAA
jgi:hypothetical protein